MMAFTSEGAPGITTSLGSGNIKDIVAQDFENDIPRTVSVQVQEMEPRLLTAVQMYTPSSSRWSLEMVRDVTPPLNSTTLVRKDIFTSPLSLCSHVTEGIGDPLTWYWRVTG